MFGAFSKRKEEKPDVPFRIQSPVTPEPRLIDTFTPEKVRKMFPAMKRVTRNINKYLPHVLEALEDAKLTDTEMVLMALATIRAESAGFEPISEYKSKYNTDPGKHPFNRYDHRSDLGNGAYGDGAKYKGRGFIQLTGKANYTEIGRMIGLGDDLMNYPDNGNEPHIASAVLAHFLKRNEGRIRNALKTNNLKKARRIVNGGSHGLKNFTDAYNKGKKLFL